MPEDDTPQAAAAALATPPLSIMTPRFQAFWDAARTGADGLNPTPGCARAVSPSYFSAAAVAAESAAWAAEFLVCDDSAAPAASGTAHGGEFEAASSSCAEQATDTEQGETWDVLVLDDDSEDEV